MELAGHYCPHPEQRRGAVAAPIYPAIPDPSLLPTLFAYGGGKQKLCCVMEVCIDLAGWWGWNTNRVNRINGAVTPGWEVVPGFSLAVCRLIALCFLLAVAVPRLWFELYLSVSESYCYLLSPHIVVRLRLLIPSPFFLCCIFLFHRIVQIDKSCFDLLPGLLHLCCKCLLFI